MQKEYSEAVFLKRSLILTKFEDLWDKEGWSHKGLDGYE